MRKITSAHFFAAILLLASCTKTDDTPKPTATQPTAKAELRLTLKMYSSTGTPASSAIVNIASSADSLNNGLYLKSMDSDAFGYALFKDITWVKKQEISTTRKIFFNASQQDGGATLKGSGEATLQENRTVNALLVLQ